MNLLNSLGTPLQHPPFPFSQLPRPRVARHDARDPVHRGVREGREAEARLECSTVECIEFVDITLPYITTLHYIALKCITLHYTIRQRLAWAGNFDCCLCVLPFLVKLIVCWFVYLLYVLCLYVAWPWRETSCHRASRTYMIHVCVCVYVCIYIYIYV